MANADREPGFEQWHLDSSSPNYGSFTSFCAPGSAAWKRLRARVIQRATLGTNAKGVVSLDWWCLCSSWIWEYQSKMARICKTQRVPSLNPSLAPSCGFFLTPGPCHQHHCRYGSPSSVLVPRVVGCGCASRPSGRARASPDAASGSESSFSRDESTFPIMK